MARTQKDNPNYGRRTMDLKGRASSDPRRITAGDLAVLDANFEHRVAETVAADHIERQHMLAVQKAMPYFRDCRDKGKLPHRLPKDILRTIADLRLV